MTKTVPASKLRAKYPIGTRIKLLSMDDPQAVPTGTRGTVRGYDDDGKLLMRWDNGRGLALVPGEDNFVKIGVIGTEIDAIIDTLIDEGLEHEEILKRLLGIWSEDDLRLYGYDWFIGKSKEGETYLDGWIAKYGVKSYCETNKHAIEIPWKEYDNGKEN